MISHMELFKISFATKVDLSETDRTRKFSMNSTLNLVTRESGTDKLKDIKLFEMPTSFSVGDVKDNLIISELEGKSEKEKETFVDNIVSSAFNAPKGLKTIADGNKKFGDILFFSARSLIAAAYRQLNDEDRRTVHYTSLGNLNAKTLGKDYIVTLGS